MVADLARAVVFVGFVAFGVWAWTRRAPASRRRAVDLLIVYVVTVSCVVGFTQRESWPFTNWALVHNVAATRITVPVVEALDAGGRGYVVDPRVFDPLPPEELRSWMLRHFESLAPAARVYVARFIRDRAETARRRFRERQSIDRSDEWLGPLRSPYHFHEGGHWRSASDVPDSPFTGLRISMLTWAIEERAVDERRLARRVLFEWHDPPSR